MASALLKGGYETELGWEEIEVSNERREQTREGIDG